MKRVTFQQPASRELQSTGHPVPADRVTRIFGAGRLKTAGWPKERRDPVSITGKHGETALAHASPHGYEAAFGAGATTATPLSKRQRVAQSNPAWGKPQGRVQGAIDRATAA